MENTQTTFSTAQLAEQYDLHPNTIRLYEKLGFISMPSRRENGYRVFTEEHIKQVEIVRIALRAEVLQNGLRKQAIEIIKTMAAREYGQAMRLTEDYLAHIETEMKFSEQAIAITEQILSETPICLSPILYTRKQAADSLNITIDTLRNWEMNGLLKVKRKENGYRVYNETDMRTLTIIRQLRVANYSLSAILRMINALNSNREINVKQVLSTPDDSDYIISVCDRLLVSLGEAQKDADRLKEKLSYLN